jgi:hypothetical protein
LKDLWQHRRQFVANKRWWPPFCLVVDRVAATVIAVEIVAGVHFTTSNLRRSYDMTLAWRWRAGGCPVRAGLDAHVVGRRDVR